MLAIAGLIVVALAAALVAFIATRPAVCEVTRTTTIAAPADVVFPHIADLRAWGDWNPFEKQDPRMSKTFTGPRSGVGSGFHYVGSRSGEGRMTIVEVVPSTRVTVRAEFIKPIAATNRLDFTIAPAATGVSLTWAMSATSGFVGKALGIILSPERMVGGAFEQGLADLKALAEAEALHRAAPSLARRAALRS